MARLAAHCAAQEGEIPRGAQAIGQRAGSGLRRVGTEDECVAICVDSCQLIGLSQDRPDPRMQAGTDLAARRQLAA
jgi:hypothetical protein